MFLYVYTEGPDILQNWLDVHSVLLHNIVCLLCTWTCPHVYVHTVGT